jgi:hypothetical protein
MKAIKIRFLFVVKEYTSLNKIKNKAVRKEPNT